LTEPERFTRPFRCVRRLPFGPSLLHRYIRASQEILRRLKIDGST
jgi:hypothetical protein